MNLEQTNALFKLYPNVVRTVGDIAYDADGNEVAYDLQAVEAKVLEMQAEEEAKNNAVKEKLAELGLTSEDLQRILGVK